MKPTEIRERLLDLRETVMVAYEQAEALREDLMSADCIVHTDIYEDSGVRLSLKDLFACVGRLSHGYKAYVPAHLDRLEAPTND